MTEKELIEKSSYIGERNRIVFHSNEQYGFGKIIRNYAFYPKMLPICAYFEHSSPPFYDKMWSLKKEFLTHIFFHREDFAEQWNQNNNSKAHTFISPFSWYRKKNNIKLQNEAKGSLFFVHHTRSDVDRFNDFIKIDNCIEQLPEEMKPVTVCFYYLDILKGSHKQYVDNGYNVVTAGDAKNPNFIENFYKVVTNYKYSITNSIGGHILFCADLGMPISYFSSLEPKHISNDEKFWESRNRLENSEVYKTARLIFEGVNLEITQEQQEFVNMMLGKINPTGRFKTSLLLYKSFLQYLPYKVKKKFNNYFKK